jgi:nucleotide-binding universal stress UspA family protein
MRPPAILVPLDGSESALAALPVAKVLSNLHQSSLCLAHVAEKEPADPELVNRLDRWAQGLDRVTIEVRAGEPAAQILRLANEIEPRMIVLCNRTTVMPRRMLGSTAAAVLGEASHPLVLVPPERGSAPWHLQHILVPHDGTPSTSVALKPAAELAELAGAELLVAHVTGVRAASAERGSLAASPYVDQPQHEWPAWTGEFFRRFACMCPLGRLHVRVLLACGNPAAELLRLAERHSTDLMVLAWRGVLKAPRAAVLREIVDQALCPLLVVRAEDRH